jgi:hypothetical protein
MCSSRPGSSMRSFLISSREVLVDIFVMEIRASGPDTMSSIRGFSEGIVRTPESADLFFADSCWYCIFIIFADDMPISDRNSASTDSTLTPLSAMTNPQYLLKYHTDKEFVDFPIWCTIARPEEFLVVYTKEFVPCLK